MFGLGNVNSRQQKKTQNTIGYKVSARQIVYHQFPPAVNNCVLQTFCCRVFPCCFFVLFPSIFRELYDLVIFEGKGHLGKVIVAMIISTNPSLIPGVNPYCLWVLAPASTMVRLLLERSAREAKCSWLRLKHFSTLEICKV